MIRKLLRLWHTIRWLRPIQFIGRFWFQVRKSRPDNRPAPPLQSPVGSWHFAWRPAAMHDATEFVFLGERRPLASASDWNHPRWPKLWLYNLHYFDDLVAEDAETRLGWHRDLIERWIAENPPGKGNGWEPYPTSLRIVNWIKWGLRSPVLDPQAIQSLAVQARWLRGRLEWHLLGNHLWANAKALVFAGAFFKDSESDAWREKGLQILRREIGEQILEDGGHFERSPMYHATLLEDLLDLIQLDGVYGGVFDARDVSLWRRIAERMLRWLRMMTHPDGGIAFFNDAAFGIAPRYEDLARYAALLNARIPSEPLSDLEALPDSGYVRLESEGAVLFVDLAPIGPDYLPGHAHADTLSFELSVNGKRVLVNGGISTYQPGDERLRQRGTAAHNTVVVDEQDSSEVWGSFRVARRARPLDVQWRHDSSSLFASASHDGYRRLPGRVVHERRFRLGAGRLVVEDGLSGKWQSAVAWFHAHPSFRIEVDGNSSGTLRSDDIQIECTIDGARNAEAREDVWHPEFGKSMPSKALSVEIAGSRLKTIFSWEN